MKKSWPITLLVCLLILGGGALILGWPRTVPFEQCSEIYQKYANEEDIKASFIKDFKVNDTVFVDVTLLEAIDSTGWDILKKDFEVDSLPPRTPTTRRQWGGLGFYKIKTQIRDRQI